jgi:prepilin-type N-terminal cleavage/methylation domain-containing protein
MASAYSRQKVLQAGFTLLELVVVATIAGLILAVVAPRIQAYRENMLLNSVAHELVRDLGRARIEALKRNEGVTLRLLEDTAYQIRTEPHRRLPAGVTFYRTGSVDSVRFASVGPVVIGAGSIVVDAGTARRRVVIRSTGQVAVQ